MRTRTGTFTISGCKSPTYGASAVSDHILHAFRFADCDLFMRFHGGGVGYKATNSFTQLFESQGESGDASDGNDDDVSEHQPGDPEEVQELVLESPVRSS